VDRVIRVTVISVGLLALALGALVGRELRGASGRPYVGFPMFPNAVVPYVVAPSGPDGARAALRFVRVQAIDGFAVTSAADVREVVSRWRIGGPRIFSFQRPDGSRHEITWTPWRLAPGELQNTYLFFVLFGYALLAVGMVPVLARPSHLPARLLFAATAGLAVPLGILVPEQLETHQLPPPARLIGVLSLSGLLHLGLVFPERRWPLTRYPRATTLAIYGGSAAVTVAFFAAFFAGPEELWLTARLGLVGLLLGFALCTTNLAATALRSSDPAYRRRARVALIGPAVVLLWFALMVSGARPMRFHLPVIVTALSLAFAILAQNLFELDAMVRRGLALAVVALVAMALYLGVFSLLESALGTAPALASALAAAGLVLIAIPTLGALRRRVEHGVEAALFPAQRRARQLVSAAAREVARLRTREDLARFVRESLAQALGCEPVRLLAGAPDAPLSELTPRAGSTGLSLPPADPLYVAIRSGREVFADGPLAPRRRRGTSRLAVQRLVELGFALAVPLPGGESRLGAILLSRRRDGRPFTPDDAALVATLAGQVTVALENAAAFEALQELERRRSAENVYLREERQLESGQGELVGESPVMRALKDAIARVAPTDAFVLVEGETGTGKELVVRSLHAQSPRRERLLVPVACAAVPEALLESELFGHERGAFTGATARKLGRFEVADGGTLFLDDVDTLPLAIQAKLLRAVQEGELQRLGSAVVRRVDVRVVAATNRDLRAEVRAGRFREDLYYRLAVVPLRVPALRERREDIARLVEHFVRQQGPRIGRRVRSVAAEALAELVAYDWPGNVRELRSVVERALVMDTGEVLRLPAPLAARGTKAMAAVGVQGDGAEELGTAPLAELMTRYKRELAQSALERAGGNHRRAAELLGLHRPSFTRMLNTLELAADDTDLETPS
jgi:transcriptional regulator with GAF, ATPase, and Fis domain